MQDFSHQQYWCDSTNSESWRWVVELILWGIWNPCTPTKSWSFLGILLAQVPRCSMFGIFTYIYQKLPKHREICHTLSIWGIDFVPMPSCFRVEVFFFGKGVLVLSLQDVFLVALKHPKYQPFGRVPSQCFSSTVNLVDENACNFLEKAMVLNRETTGFIPTFHHLGLGHHITHPPCWPVSLMGCGNGGEQSAHWSDSGA